MVIAGLLLLVAFSYRQTIHAYPGGGGAYIVAKDNIGPAAGLVAAAALLIDYVMTVAVSIAAGVAAVVSALPQWHINRTELCVAFVVLIAIGNLRGIRLAFSNGIVVLSVLAGILIVAFEGDTHALIPLYMIGVFVSFTLSQAGMVRKWRREGGEGWLGSALFNLIGAASTGLVLVVVAVTKFAEGAWIILVLIPLLVLWFRSVHKHYARVAEQLSLRDFTEEARPYNTVLVPISGVHRAVAQALQYAKMLGSDVRAVFVDVDPNDTANVRREWERWGQAIPLVVLPSPYRSLMEPLLEYIEQVDAEGPDDFITIVLPEFVPARWWHHLLHNQRALLFKRNTVVTSVPFHLRK